jgi:signal transduction histidine kinase
LRSAIVGIYPPNLRQAGLTAALSDLVARLGSHGIETTLDLGEGARFDADLEELLYRVCQEALRNVEQHAGAHRVRVTLRREDGRAVLEISDDGRGVAADRAVGSDGDHVGLDILEDVVGDAGGRMTVGSGDGGRGTTVHVEVPAT